MDGDPADDAAELPAARSSQPEFDFADDEDDRPARRGNRSAPVAAAAIAAVADDAVAADGDAAQGTAKRGRRTAGTPSGEAAGAADEVQAQAQADSVGAPVAFVEVDPQVDAISAGTLDPAEAAAPAAAMSPDDVTPAAEAVADPVVNAPSAPGRQSRGLFDGIAQQDADRAAVPVATGTEATAAARTADADAVQADAADADAGDADAGEAGAAAPASPAATAVEQVVAAQDAGDKDDQAPNGA